MNKSCKLPKTYIEFSPIEKLVMDIGKIVDPSWGCTTVSDPKYIKNGQIVDKRSIIEYRPKELNKCVEILEEWLRNNYDNNQ